VLRFGSLSGTSRFDTVNRPDLGSNLMLELSSAAGSLTLEIKPKSP
jgi:hypothetical protein